jgi:peptide deformylase
MINYIKNPDHSGVGLAAPQVGITKRIMVVSLLRDWEDEGFQTIMMINPEILEFSTETTHEVEEGCLSLPKTKRGYVQRHKEIKLKYFDEKFKEKTLRLS